MLDMKKIHCPNPATHPPTYCSQRTALHAVKKDISPWSPYQIQVFDVWLLLVFVTLSQEVVLIQRPGFGRPKPAVVTWYSTPTLLTSAPGDIPDWPKWPVSFTVWRLPLRVHRGFQVYKRDLQYICSLTSNAVSLHRPSMLWLHNQNLNMGEETGRNRHTVPSIII